MPFPRRKLPLSENYVTQEAYTAKIAELEKRISEYQSSITSIIENIDFPDYSKRRSLSANTTYTFDTNGYVLLGLRGGNGNRYIDTVINGWSYRWYGDTGSYKYGWGCMQLCFPLKRGTSFRFANSTNNQSMSFAFFISC